MPILDMNQNLEAEYAILRDGNITLTFSRLLDTRDNQDIVLTNNRHNYVYFMLTSGNANCTTNTIKYHRGLAISNERICLCGGCDAVTNEHMYCCVDHF